MMVVARKALEYSRLSSVAHIIMGYAGLPVEAF
jgi:hypothetical protein